MSSSPNPPQEDPPDNGPPSNPDPSRGYAPPAANCPLPPGYQAPPGVVDPARAGLPRSPGIPGYGDLPGDRSKVADFLLGLFGVCGVQIVLTIFLGMFLGPLLQEGAFGAIGTVEALFMAGVIVYFVKAGRRFIVYGYLAGLLTPVALGMLLLGACFLAL